jgi:hypothetical protein
LLCKYCKEGESVFTHFRAPHKQKIQRKEKRENKKNKKNVGIKKNIYISMKRVYKNA